MKLINVEQSLIRKTIGFVIILFAFAIGFYYGRDYEKENAK